jgi:hypothetical protein
VVIRQLRKLAVEVQFEPGPGLVVGHLGIAHPAIVAFGGKPGMNPRQR